MLTHIPQQCVRAALPRGLPVNAQEGQCQSGPRRGLGMPPLLRQFPTGAPFPLFAGPWDIPVPKLKSHPRFSLVLTALLCYVLCVVI